METGEAEVRAVIDRFVQAVGRKDAQALVDCYADEVVGFELGPPLEISARELRDPLREQRWFDNWKGPLESTAREVRVRVRGDLAIAHALQHLKGTTVKGEAVDLWFRATAAFEKQGGQWKIVHIHNSFPVAMEGGKAHVDPKPL